MCVCSRPLWVSPRNSPVRLGVSPAAASTPAGVFNQWFEALFPGAGTLGCAVCHRVHQLLPCGPAADLPTRLHNPPPGWVHQLLPCPRVLSAHLPISTRPTGLDECFFFISLVVGLHTVRFSVSSGGFSLNCCCPSFGCAGRRSVSIYASILAGNHIDISVPLFILPLSSS